MRPIPSNNKKSSHEGNQHRSSKNGGLRGYSGGYTGGGHTLDSMGPEGKIRGTARQIVDRYLTLARDALSSGDHVGAEGFFQHAEHYLRILSEGAGNAQHSSSSFSGQKRYNRRYEGEEDTSSQTAPSPPPASPVPLTPPLEPPATALVFDSFSPSQEGEIAAELPLETLSESEKVVKRPRRYKKSEKPSEA